MTTMGSPSPSRLGYVPALDGLRGIAIAGVVVCHLWGIHGGRVATGGFFGVDLFFVLSGFLITTLLLEERDRTGQVSLRGFWARRARRLLPASMGLALVFLVINGLGGQLDRGLLAVAGGALYDGNIVHVLDPRFAFGPLDHLWSLAEEEQFYLLWPLLLVFALRRVNERMLLRVLGAATMLFAVYRVGLGLAGADANRLWFGPDTHADGLLLGCTAAVFRRGHAWRPSPGLAVGAFAAVLAAFALGDQADTRWLMFGLPLVNVAAVLLVLAATTAGRAAAVMEVRPLVALGAISYGLYVWHQFARWLLGWGHPWIALPLSLALAVASYRLIEQLFLRPASEKDPRGERRVAAGGEKIDGLVQIDLV
jgi:peptidoglycan/LPS O-acetylase OafA/YrhL